MKYLNETGLAYLWNNKLKPKFAELTNKTDQLIDKTRINLLRPTLQTTTKNGVTCTNNGDGTYTLNGTASDDTAFTLSTPNLKGKYNVVGCPNGGGFSNSYCLVQFGTSWTPIVDSGDGVVYDFEGTEHSTVIRVASGTICNNVLFKPMITDDLSATYDDFVSGFDCFTPDLKMDLLWTNASPTSAFAPQTISLDLSNYKWVCIVFLINRDNNSCKITLSEIGLRQYITSAYANKIIQRTYHVNLMGFIFENNEYDNGIDNDYHVPYKIYGAR